MKKLLLILVSIVFIGSISGCNNKRTDTMAWAYRALGWSKMASESANDVFKEWGRGLNKTCLTIHKSGTDGYRDCMKPWFAVREKWTGCKMYAKPPCTGGFWAPLVKAHKTAYFTLDVAYKATDKEVDIKKIVVPALCATVELIDVVRAAGVKFGDAQSTIDTVLNLAESFCD